MRTLNKNHQQMSIYRKAIDQYYKGNYNYDESLEKILSRVANRENIVQFFNGIAGKLSKSVMKAFGIDDSSTYAQMDTLANEYPFGKGTYIWRKSEIQYKDTEKTIVDVSSADYIIENVLDEGIQFWNYLLQRTLK